MKSGLSPILNLGFALPFFSPPPTRRKVPCFCLPPFLFSYHSSPPSLVQPLYFLLLELQQWVPGGWLHMNVTFGLEKGGQWVDFLPDSLWAFSALWQGVASAVARTDHSTIESLPLQSQRSLNKVFSLRRVRSREEVSHQKQNGDSTTGLLQAPLESGLRWIEISSGETAWFWTRLYLSLILSVCSFQVDSSN